ncbi:hypothetical protein SAMN04488057_11873 [Cyclobacterium lianum]|uniref:NVEALA protein n=1 Tax=Cyclobacterium lianum TaxID=388280 RepID=A0A1M7QIR4_9BACT|nr:hypothetical protein [Cyclobacterium lianum]SHN30722.1 hypothetical protein SAMN04488057_11873 [Cyclobacterium lianum]
MKNVVKTSKWLRWTAAGAFGLMLTLNVMVGLDFEKGNVLPSLTLSNLSNTANAQSETGHAYNDFDGYDCCKGAGNCYISDPKIC